jgi:hypothetical protein
MKISFINAGKFEQSPAAVPQPEIVLYVSKNENRIKLG